MGSTVIEKRRTVKEINKSIRVMVVDDERDIRDGSKRIIERLGFEAEVAERGSEALERLKQKRFSIVLLDLKMPGMDGMEVLGHIREMDESTLVIVITGFATVETAIEAMKQGAYDFIPKPFEPDQLRIVVNRAAEKITITHQAQMLARERQRTLIDLDTEKSRLSTILQSLPDGVIVTNALAKVVLINPAARQMLELPTEMETGRDIGVYIANENITRLIGEISQGKHIDYEDIAPQEIETDEQRYLMLKVQPVLGERNECLGGVVNIVDVTDLKVIDRLRSEFVAKVSHELRSPLSTIHEQLAVVLRDSVNAVPERNQGILTRAKEKTHSLISLISDLLDLSRIEEGLICKEPQPVQLEDLLADIVNFLKARAEAKHQSLVLAKPDNPLPPLQADPLALESIFGNLISNAINYTQDGGAIEVRVEQAGINLQVKVIDNGFGIEEKHLENIFKRFYRVKNDQTRFITGTGLGLPIVKQLLDASGGMIDVESSPGVGTTFTVLIPTEYITE
jgi:signal transduction histidine kinase/FixJ family two-component response regulator